MDPGAVAGKDRTRLVRAVTDGQHNIEGLSRKLIDDFHIKQDDRFIHVLNAPSPAATASLSIGRSIAEMARKNFGLS